MQKFPLHFRCFRCDFARPERRRERAAGWRGPEADRLGHVPATTLCGPCLPSSTLQATLRLVRVLLAENLDAADRTVNNLAIEVGSPGFWSEPDGCRANGLERRIARAEAAPALAGVDD